MESERVVGILFFGFDPRHLFFLEVMRDE